MNNKRNMKIIETQQESEKDDEIFFTLLADEKIVSWAKSVLYSNLEDIHTASLEKRKGFGQQMLSFIEKKAQNHFAPFIKTNNFDASNDEAIGFFKKMFYEINPSITTLNTPMNATKFFKSCRIE